MENTDKENEYPKKGQSQSGTNHAYSVQARYDYPEPKVFGDIILHKEWKTIYFPKSRDVGVPTGNALDWAGNQMGLMSYQAAQALRWWFHANAEAEILGSLCLETRIVKHKVEYSIKEEAISDHEYIGGDDRSNVMPDWGKKD